MFDIELWSWKSLRMGFVTANRCRSLTDAIKRQKLNQNELDARRSLSSPFAHDEWSAIVSAVIWNSESMCWQLYDTVVVCIVYCGFQCIPHRIQMEMSQESQSAVNLREKETNFRRSSKRMNNETTQVIRMFDRIPERQSLVAGKMLAAHSNGSRRISRTIPKQVYSSRMNADRLFLTRHNCTDMNIFLLNPMQTQWLCCRLRSRRHRPTHSDSSYASVPVGKIRLCQKPLFV